MEARSILQKIKNEHELRDFLERAKALAVMPIGQVLLKEGAITEEMLNDAIKLKKVLPEKRLGDVLLDLGMVDNKTLQLLLYRQIGIPTLDLDGFVCQHELTSLLPAAVARKNSVLPLLNLTNTFVVASDHLPSQLVYDELRFHLQKNVMIVLAERSQIEERIRQFYDLITENLEAENKNPERTSPNDARVWQEAEYLAKQKPIVKLVNSIFSEALTLGASDIHLRPNEADLKLIFRVDGELHAARSIEKNLQAAIVSRIKILANMNIAEHRLPQDGRILIQVNEQDIDLRVSMMPTPHGENVVIRVLGANQALRSLEDIGYNGIDLQRLKEMVHKESGLVLVTGPTGAGKSTTLYAMLQAVARDGINIVTIEDPIEYHQPKMVQIQLLASQGFGFPQTLRHVLRQDPDVIMIGEIRDAETAQLAFEAALTGHLVLSTLHTTSACGAVPRLLELGISPQIMKSALLGVLAQRLVRHNCPHCLQQEVISELVSSKLGLKDLSPYRIGKGCKLCSQYGYKGRVAVYELFEPDAAMREHFSTSITEYQLAKLAAAAGMKSMLRYGHELAKQGQVSLLDVYRAST